MLRNRFGCQLAILVMLFATAEAQGGWPTLASW
jgi:hypothetical protein